jgi:hypothetical protein
LLIPELLEIHYQANNLLADVENCLQAAQPEAVVPEL